MTAWRCHAGKHGAERGRGWPANAATGGMRPPRYGVWRAPGILIPGEEVGKWTPDHRGWVCALFRTCPSVCGGCGAEYGRAAFSVCRCLGWGIEMPSPCRVCGTSARLRVCAAGGTSACVRFVCRHKGKIEANQSIQSYSPQQESEREDSDSCRRQPTNQAVRS